MSEYNGNNSTPVELRAIESALSDLGEIERGSAPAGLESRLLAGTCRMLSVEDAPVVIARIGNRVSFVARLRVAASVVIVGGLAALYLNLGHSNSLPVTTLSSTMASALEEDMNFVLELRAADESLSAMGEKIDTLFMDASSIGDSLNSDPSTSLLEGTS